MIRMAGPSVPETAERGWSETTPEAHARAVKTIDDPLLCRTLCTPSCDHLGLTGWRDNSLSTLLFLPQASPVISAEIS